MLRTGKEYLQSIRDGRRVLCGGEWIDDITTHPKTRGYGPLVDLARKVCDLGDIDEMVKRADEERRKIIEVRDRPDYIKGQDVETV